MSHKTHSRGNNLAGRLLFPVRAERRTNQPAWCPVSWMRTARQRGPQGHVREVHPLHPRALRSQSGGTSGQRRHQDGRTP